MKSFAKSLKRQDGFTLVELMVVVAIIGLLSAVAIPNFKKYQAKAKMSEAKLQLSAAYTAESAFFSDFNMYSHCLAYMGFDPNAERPSRYYAIGFSSTAGARPNGGHNAIDPAAQTSAVNSGLEGTVGCPAAYAQNVAAVYAAGTATPGITNLFPAGKGVGSAIAIDGTYIAPTDIGSQINTANMIFTIGAGGVIDGAATSLAAATCSSMTINEQKVIAIVRNGF